MQTPISTSRVVTGRQVYSPNGLTSLSRTTVWRGVRAGWFPAPIKISPGGRIGWFLDEIEEFLATRPRTRATQF